MLLPTVIAGLLCASKSGYDFLQAQRIQKQGNSVISINTLKDNCWNEFNQIQKEGLTPAEKDHRRNLKWNISSTQKSK